jgi:hypothetical protein
MDTTDPYCEFLVPGQVRLTTDDSNRVRLTLMRDRSYPEVQVVRAFPLSDLDRYIGLLDARAGNKVIGLIADPGQLDPASRRTLTDSVDGHYFVPPSRQSSA